MGNPQHGPHIPGCGQLPHNPPHKVQGAEVMLTPERYASHGYPPFPFYSIPQKQDIRIEIFCIRISGLKSQDIKIE
jgi:hypothetical protein